MSPEGKEFGKLQEQQNDWDDEDLRKWVLEYMKNDTLPKDEFFRRANYLMNWIKTGETKK